MWRPCVIAPRALSWRRGLRIVGFRRTTSETCSESRRLSLCPEMFRRMHLLLQACLVLRHLLENMSLGVALGATPPILATPFEIPRVRLFVALLSEASFKPGLNESNHECGLLARDPASRVVRDRGRRVCSPPFGGTIHGQLYCAVVRHLARSSWPHSWGTIVPCTVGGCESRPRKRPAFQRAATHLRPTHLSQIGVAPRCS